MLLILETIQRVVIPQFWILQRSDQIENIYFYIFKFLSRDVDNNATENL